MKFINFSIFFIYHTLKGSFELCYYLWKKSVCQMVIEISGGKVACAVLHKEIFNRGVLGRFDGEVIRSLRYESDGQIEVNCVYFCYFFQKFR